MVPLPSMRPSRAPAGQPGVPGPYGSRAAPLPRQQAGTEEVQIEGEPSFGGNVAATAGPDRLSENWQAGAATQAEGGRILDYRGGRAPLGEPATALRQQPPSIEAGEVRKPASGSCKWHPTSCRCCRSLSRSTLLRVPTC